MSCQRYSFHSLTISSRAEEVRRVLPGQDRLRNHRHSNEIRRQAIHRRPVHRSTDLVISLYPRHTSAHWKNASSSSSSENVPHNFQLELEVYALNKTLALSSAGKDFADRYSYFSTHGSPLLRRKPVERETTAQPKAAEQQQQQSKFVLIARATFTKDDVNKMPKVRTLTMERRQDNPLMQLPIESCFTSRFLVQPLYCTRPAAFAGIVEHNHIPYSTVLTSGFLNGEQIVRNDFMDRRTFSVPITLVSTRANNVRIEHAVQFRTPSFSHATITCLSRSITAVSNKRNSSFKTSSHSTYGFVHSSSTSSIFVSTIPHSSALTRLLVVRNLASHR